MVSETIAMVSDREGFLHNEAERKAKYRYVGINDR